MKGKEIFYIQLVLMVLLFFMSNLPYIFSNLLLLIPFLAGIVLAGVTLFSLGIDSYSPFPEPRGTKNFSQKGFYKYARHPAYMAIMIVGMILVVSNPRFDVFLVFLVLVYILNLKADYEEELLLKRDPEYGKYKSVTRKFVPYIY